MCTAIGAILSRGALQMHFAGWLVSLLFSGGGLSLKKCILNQIALDQKLFAIDYTLNTVYDFS